MARLPARIDVSTFIDVRPRDFLLSLVIGVPIALAFFIFVYPRHLPFLPSPPQQVPQNDPEIPVPAPLLTDDLRKRTYNGGTITVEEDLGEENGVHRYVVSYPSDELTLRAVMDVPPTPMPKGGYPVIILNHGTSDQPKKYDPVNEYKPYELAYANAGFLVFKPDYRGHAQSEGSPTQDAYAPEYIVDVLNLVASVQRYPQADAGKIGMWGHSLGGVIVLHALEISPDVKAGVNMAGPAPTSEQYRQLSPEKFHESRGREVDDIRKNIDLITVPLQLHQGLSDGKVRPEFMKSTHKLLEAHGKDAELFPYPGGKHNLDGADRVLFLERTTEFFGETLGQ